MKSRFVYVAGFGMMHSMRFVYCEHNIDQPGEYIVRSERRQTKLVLDSPIG